MTSRASGKSRRREPEAAPRRYCHERRFDGTPILQHVRGKVSPSTALTELEGAKVPGRCYRIRGQASVTRLCLRDCCKRRRHAAGTEEWPPAGWLQRQGRLSFAVMGRRYALLDDNQRLLERRLGELGGELPDLVRERCCAAMVIGSVARGCAGDRSDVDLLLVLREGTPRRADYDWWERNVAPHLGALAAEPFRVEPLIVGRAALETTEPNLRHALETGIPIWDPEGLFGEEPATRP